MRYPPGNSPVGARPIHVRRVVGWLESQVGPVGTSVRVAVLHTDRGSQKSWGPTYMRDRACGQAD